MAKFTIQDKINAVLQYLQGEQPKGRSPMKKKWRTLIEGKIPTKEEIN